MSFVKTTQGVIINTDDSYYKAIVAQRESEKKAREMETKMQDLESEITEIRDLLKQVINRK
jgi:hypothetical protein